MVQKGSAGRDHDALDRSGPKRHHVNVAVWLRMSPESQEVLRAIVDA
jgi:hypothetical protein